MIMTVAALGLAGPLYAQGRSAVSSAELDAAVVSRPDANREAIRQLLATPQAQKVAGQMGVSPSELSARVAALDQATVNQLAQQAQVNDPALAGGSSTVVIGTTALIIALLVIILLIAA
jgi:CHASE3 domain sensor protein